MINTKTILVWTDFEHLARFVVLDGNYTRWEGALVNSACIPEDIQDEICAVLFNPEAELTWYDNFPVEEFNNAYHTGQVVIVNCGCIP